MGNSFDSFDVSIPWGNRSHTNSSFPVGNSYLPMGETASVPLPCEQSSVPWVSEVFSRV